MLFLWDQLGFECLGSFTEQGHYKYHSFGPCIWPSTFQSQLTSPFLCQSSNSCKSAPLTFATSKIDVQNQKALKVIGIAKDGHQILGPYKNDGSLWQPCEVDICNGVQLNGSYYYVLTTFFPYTIGCWGPASSLGSFQLSCTSNQRVCNQRMLEEIPIHFENENSYGFNAIQNVGIINIIPLLFLLKQFL